MRPGLSANANAKRDIAPHRRAQCSHDGRTDNSYDRYAHYYVGPIDAAEAFVREAKRAGFDARLLTG